MLRFVIFALASAICFGETAGPAVIVNSGSTNRAGFRITVERSGSARYMPNPRAFGPSRGKAEPRERQIPQALVKRFYADLTAAQPFSALPARHCAKSVSFGFTLRIQFDGAETPDLSCGDGGDTKLKALIQDTGEITKAMTQP